MILSRCVCGCPAGKHVPLDDRGSRRGACRRGGCDCERYQVPRIATGGEAFPERRHAGYRQFIATLPCITAGKVWRGRVPSGQLVTFVHHCEGRVDPMHVKTKATGAFDVGEVLPGCRRTHDWQEECGGIEAWARGYGWSMDELHAMALALVPLWERDVLGMPAL